MSKVDPADSGKANFGLFWIMAIVLAILPFGEEPHLVGKLRWVSGGAVGMQAMDWFDLLMHGLPITVLAIWQIRTWVLKARQKA